MKTKKLAQKHGLDARVFDMADVDLSVLSKTKNLIVFVATWGEGDPPGRAVDFYAALMRDDAPRLDKDIRFAVLALGDTAYTQFCAVGKAIDARLAALGATRAVERVDLDLDFAKKAADGPKVRWASLRPRTAATRPSCTSTSRAATQLSDDEPLYTAENPLQGEIAQLTNLNGTGSTRETWHVEITADNSGFSYLPGDSIGILPDNDPALALGGRRSDRSRRRRRGSQEAARELRRDDVVALADRGLRQAHRPHGCNQARRSEGLSRRSLRTASSSICSRPILKNSSPRSSMVCCGRCRDGFTRLLPASQRIRVKRTSWSARCAGSRTDESARASPRRILPTGGAWAIR